MENISWTERVRNDEALG